MTTPEELRGDIERTRDQLGETVEALVGKVDVKARAQQKAAQVKVDAQQKGADAAAQVARRAKSLTGQLSGPLDERSGALVAAGAAMLAVAAWLVVWRARRRA